MKKLYNYVNNVNEAVTNPERTVGKPAEKNGTGGKFAIDEPTDNEAVEPLQKDQLNKNMKRLLMKFKAEEPFFIMGEAGWGKTSIIKSMAKRFGRRVITVYLDKCEATDLGGIPVPRENKHGKAYVDSAMPMWAQYMLEHEDEQFLLFFDEMNQADGAVMNALMPIVLETEVCGVKFDNFIVGAAGNFEYENESGINELSGPLKSRFKPIIIWETGGDMEWKQAFDYMHKNWDDKLGPDGVEFINLIFENRSLFINPREVEHKILKWTFKIMHGDDKDLFDVEDYLDRLEGLTKEELDRTEQSKLTKLAEATFNLVNGNPLTPQKARGKGKDMISDKLKKTITNAVKSGYISQNEDGRMVKYGISRENAPLIFCDPEMSEEPINREMLDRFLNKLEADGVVFKYDTNADWKKAGLKDPFED